MNSSLPSPSAGLSSAEAARRLAQYGWNDPAPKKQRSQLVELLLQFADPLVAILLFASIVSAFVGELVNATIVIVIVLLSVAINFVQTFRSQRSADRLRATVAPTATVLRDGLFAEVHRIEVVPGDVVRLSAGDLVPADARLLEAKDLHVQITIPTDNVDPEVLQKPQRWDIRTIRNFMLIIGPISSLYDFLTFYVLLSIFHADEVLFHTGWFVESLATQTLVLFVIRTPRNPLASRPSAPLVVTTLAIVLIGAALPFTPLAGVLGFEPLPAKYFLFLAGATVTYLLLVELAKRYLLGGARKYRQGVPIAST